jgi:RNA polymerase sigma-70 factor, ECF subfamily
MAGTMDRGADLAALVAAAREGDDVAVAALVRATQRDVWKLCQVLGSHGETDDLVQETYLRAFASLSGFRGEAPFRSWLLTIARRTCADHVRRRQRERRLMIAVRGTATADQAPGREHTEELLTVLDPDRREAFVLTQVVGLSYEDAAEVLGCPIGTVRSRVARARAELLAAHRVSDIAR